MFGDIVEGYFRSRNPIAYEVGAELGRAWARRRLTQQQEAARRANLRRFELTGNTPDAQYAELLRIAQDEGLLRDVQHDPRVQAIGFTVASEQED